MSKTSAEGRNDSYRMARAGLLHIAAHHRALFAAGLRFGQTYRRSVLFVATLILGVGLASAYLLVREESVLVRVEASGQNIEAVRQWIFSSVPQDLVTSASAGGASIRWHYKRPVNVRSVTQVIVEAGDSSAAMSAMSLQYKDLIGSWLEAARSRWPQENFRGPHLLETPESLSSIYSTEWRLVALEGGDGTRLVMGWIYPPRLKASWIQSYAERNYVDIDVLFVITCLLAVGLIAYALPDRFGLIVFTGSCVTVTLLMNLTLFGLVCPPLTWTPDSASYLTWPPSPVRMPGINLAYSLLHEIIGYSGLLALQVNLVLVSYLAALACLAVAMKRYWPFIPLTMLPGLWGNFLQEAMAVLSEPWFVAGALLAGSGLMAVVLNPGRLGALMAAFGLLLIIISKPVGPVLIIAVTIAYRFIPAEPSRRLRLLAIIVSPAIAAYLAMSAYGQFAYGRWSPTVLGGYALAGNVAWMLDAEDLPLDYQQTGREVVGKLQQLYADMPRLTQTDQYVDFTTIRYGDGLYSVIVPAFYSRAAELSRTNGSSVSTNPGVAANEVLEGWALAAIRHHPIRYLSHCMLHFWGLWRYGLTWQLSMGDVAKTAFRYGFQEQNEVRDDYRSYLEGWQRQTESRSAAVSFALLSSSGPWPRAVAFVCMITGVLLSVLYLLPKGMTRHVAPLVVGALFVNAYYASHALTIVSITRYGEAIVPLFPLFFGLAVAQLGAFAAALPAKLRTNRP